MTLPRSLSQVILALLCMILLGLVAILALGLGPAEAARGPDPNVPCDATSNLSCKSHLQ